MEKYEKRKLERNEKRRLKLTGLIRDKCAGINANLARKLKKEPSYINRLLYPEGKEGKKNIGEEIMDAVIDAYDLPENWWTELSEENPYGIDFSKATLEKIDFVKEVIDMDNEEFHNKIGAFEAVAAVPTGRKKSNDEK